MKKIATLIAALAFSTSAFAALSPLNQSIVEIRALIESPEMQQYLPPSQQIVAIEKDEEQFMIETTDYAMVVDIIYTDSERIGPKQFKFIFHKPEES